MIGLLRALTQIANIALGRPCLSLVGLARSIADARLRISRSSDVEQSSGIAVTVLQTKPAICSARPSVACRLPGKPERVQEVAECTQMVVGISPLLSSLWAATIVLSGRCVATNVFSAWQHKGEVRPRLADRQQKLLSACEGLEKDPHHSVRIPESTDNGL
jgi:hypothetical protein